MRNNMNNNKKILIIGSLFLLVLLGVSMFIFQQKPVVKTDKPIPTSFNRFQPSTAPTLIPHPTLGSMRFYSMGGIKRFSKGKEFSLLVQASSQGKNIVGYDAIVSYDKKHFTYVRTVSKLPEFNVFSYERPAYLSLSAIKSLQDTKVTSWINQDLVELVFQPNTIGKYSFLLIPMGKETSKLVDDKAQVVYPATEKLEVEIY